MTIDLTQFHDSFFEESLEALASMEETLLKLDVGAPDPDMIATIFRVAHSIKGGAATLGFGDIASFTHTLETLLDELRGQRMKVTNTLSDLLLRSVDVMREMIHGAQQRKPVDAQRIADLQFDLELAVAQRGAAESSLAAEAAVAAAAAPDASPATGAESPKAEEADERATYRIHFRPHLQLLARGNDPLRMFNELRQLGDLEMVVDASGLPAIAGFDPENCYLAWELTLRSDANRDAIVDIFDWAEGDCELRIETVSPARQVKELIVAPDTDAAAPAAATPAATASAVERGAEVNAAGEVPRAARGPDAHKNQESGSIRVSIEKIDDLMNSVGELVITQAMLSQFSQLQAGPEGERLRSGLAQLERNVRELQESIMRVRMVPISFVFSRFPRMVRDLSQRLNKQVELKMTGGDTELDKTVLEKIGDPLVHLVRNSVDHGIEMPDARVAAGKSACGTVHLHAYHRGSSIMVEVRDDGAGLKRERILAKARQRGLLGPDETPNDEGINQLIFMAGFSTADQATDISGRGVGMDVVRRNVEELGGSIEIRSVEGKGSTFVISLPLTLAIVDGQTVAVGEESYIVPLTAIVESLRARDTSIQNIVGHGEVLAFRGEYLPVVRLEQLFRTPRRTEARSRGLIMVVEGDGRRIGLCVDELLGQQQVVVKTLEENYGRVDGVAGATILGDGSVALILDVAGLSRAAMAQAH
ncbi:MAG: chemotaxis protein CheA [Steroidobacteraceae bacterium]